MQQLNLSSEHHRTKKGHKTLKTVFIISMVVALVVLLISFLNGSSTVFKFALPGIGLKSTDDKVNVLLLGNAGGTHDGPYLTDTMMVASYNLKTNQANFISMPRDLWLTNENSKINALYEKGQTQNQGLKYTETTIGNLLGIPIHYGVRLDFSGFVRAIDTIGGVDVDIKNTFDDYFYPIAGKEDDLCGWTQQEKDFSPDEAKQYNVPVGKMQILEKDGQIATNSADPDIGQQIFTCRYEHIHYDKGPSHLDGTLALKFVRSRHASGVEGSDFARSARQQLVIEAFRKKALSFGTLANPSKIKGLISDFGQSFETDMPVDDMLELFSLSKKVKQTNNYVIDTSGENPILVNPPLQDYGGAWVLVPAGGNFDRIHQYIKDILSGKLNQNEASSSVRPSQN